MNNEFKTNGDQMSNTIRLHCRCSKLSSETDHEPHFDVLYCNLSSVTCHLNVICEDFSEAFLFFDEGNSSVKHNVVPCRWRLHSHWDLLFTANIGASSCLHFKSEDVNSSRILPVNCSLFFSLFQPSINAVHSREWLALTKTHQLVL